MKKRKNRGTLFLSKIRKKMNTVENIKARKKLRIGAFAHVPGYSYWNADSSKMEGFEADLARLLTKELFGSENYAEFIKISETEALESIKTDRIDIAICYLTITPSRTDQIDFTKPYIVDKYIFLVNKDSQINN